MCNPSSKVSKLIEVGADTNLTELATGNKMGID